MDSKILVFPRFTPVTDHFHRRVFVGLKKKKIYIYIYISPEEAFQGFNCLLLQVGTAVYVPPLPKMLCTTANRGLRRTNFWECNSLMQTMWHQYMHQ